MQAKENKQLRDAIETLNDHVFGEFTEHRLIEPVVAILVMNLRDEFEVRYMEIPDICILEGRKGEKGWHILKRRMTRMVAHARRDGMKVVLLYHAAVPDDCSEERIVIVTRTGTDLERVRETHFLPEYGQMSVDETGRLKMCIPRFREL